MTDRLIKQIKETDWDFNLDFYSFLRDCSGPIHYYKLKSLIQYLEKYIISRDGRPEDVEQCSIEYIGEDDRNGYDERIKFTYHRPETDKEYEDRNNKELQHRIFIEAEAKKLGLIK